MTRMDRNIEKKNKKKQKTKKIQIKTRQTIADKRLVQFGMNHFRNSLFSTE